MPSIEDVRTFWNTTPLWVGDEQSRGTAGSHEFFISHYEACLSEVGGRTPPRMTPLPGSAILDLGCGIGFWLQHFHNIGFQSLTAADLSQTSLDLAKRRCALFGINAELSVQNAEAMTFDSARFDHVNCIGVIHHSPNPEAALREIWRVLKPGGRAVVSVYYTNIVLRHWSVLHSLVRLAGHVISLGGRGRDSMLRDAASAGDLVRLYDGRDNPIGISFTREEWVDLICSSAPWTIHSLFTYVFPSRALPIPIPNFLYRLFEWVCPMMICAVLIKPLDHSSKRLVRQG